jgi:ribosomal protein S27AE
MNNLASSQVLIQLKYCERCGGLFLRAHETHVIYCHKCRLRCAKWEQLSLTPASVTQADRRDARVPVFKGRAAKRRRAIAALQGIASQTGARPC